MALAFRIAMVRIQMMYNYSSEGLVKHTNWHKYVTVSTGTEKSLNICQHPCLWTENLFYATVMQA